MGKITKFTLVKEDSQLLQLKTGPISILMGRNLRKPVEKPPAQEKEEKEES